MEKEKNNKEKEIIETIYKSQLEKLDKIIIEKNKEIKKVIKEYDIDSIIKTIFKLLNNIEENYNIKISEYNKIMYKQGFIDGINLMIECIS